MNVLRIDDIPLLYSQAKEIGIQQAVDQTIQPHGNRSGLSLGHLLSIWLCYLLSESDHRLSSVEKWVGDNLVLLRSLSGEYEMTAKDFTDDRLEQALDYLSDAEKWSKLNHLLFANSLEVYSMDSDTTVRLDAAPMQGHHQVKEPEGLFQHGYSKHHDNRLGMAKVMLACLDNQVNGFSYPLSHITVSGERADDGLYLPVIKECNRLFSGTSGRPSQLYVGDSKMGSKENRWYIANSGHGYLLPLSKKQFSSEALHKAIARFPKADYRQVYQEGGPGVKKLIAEGFELEAQVEYTDGQGQKYQWTERRVFVLSTAYSQAQQKSLDTKLAKARQELAELLTSKKGKGAPKDLDSLQAKINEVLISKNIVGLLDVKVEQQEHKKQVRAYKDRPARVETSYTFELDIQLNRDKIDAHKASLGWRVYGTNTDSEQLDFERCVWKYRQQNRVEARFNDLRNKVVPLVPIFVKKDNRVEALINVLMLGLKMCAVMEYKAAKKLGQEHKKLAGIYEGNPKKTTDRPTAKRLLRQFTVSLVILFSEKANPTEIKLTPIGETQKTIIELLNFEPGIYDDLPMQIQMYFSSKQISEN